MAKFIELTDREDGIKRLININEIVGFHEEADGCAFVEVRSNVQTNDMWGFYTVEQYKAIYNELIACDVVLFGGLV
ncbi:MAG: hypothetical protein K2L88_05790 [Clostridiales bacterium]|nr:hypothetical protein [Clostridiales bacterium]